MLYYLGTRVVERRSKCVSLTFFGDRFLKRRPGTRTAAIFWDVEVGCFWFTLVLASR